MNDRITPEPIEIELTKQQTKKVPVAQYRNVLVQTRGGATYGKIVVQRSNDNETPVAFDPAISITADGMTKVETDGAPFLHFITDPSTGSPSGTAELIIWGNDFQP